MEGDARNDSHVDGPVDEMMSRIERLERAAMRSHRQSRRWMAAAVGLGGLLAMGQTRTPPTTLEARDLVLRDAAGKERVKITASDSGASVTLLDAKGMGRVGLTLAGDSAGIGLYDEAQRPRFAVSLGDAGAASLMMLGKDRGQIRVALNGGDEGSRLLLNDAKGEPRLSFSGDTTSSELSFVVGDKPVLSLEGNAEGARIALSDPGETSGVELEAARDLASAKLGRRQDKSAIDASVGKDGPSLLLKDAAGKTRTALGSSRLERKTKANQGSPASLLLLDAEGKPQFEAP